MEGFSRLSNGQPRVIHVLTRLNVGGITHQLSLLRDLGKEQTMNITVAAGWGDASEGDCRPSIRGGGLPVDDLRYLSNDVGLWCDIRALIELYKLFRRQRPTIVHLHMFKARLFGGIAARLAAVPVIVETLHGNLLEGYYNRALSRFLLVVEKIIARALVDLVVVPIEMQRQQLVALGVAPSGKLRVQHYGFDVNAFTDVDRLRGQLRQKYGISQDALVVGVLCRLVPIKGVRDFLGAAQRLCAAAPGKLFFVVGGDGPLRMELERVRHELGIENSCRFLGMIKEPREFYADVDIIVSSSINEGTPVSLLEAMACGKAIVATSVGGVPEMVSQGECAELVPPRDPDALAKAILDFAQKPEKRRKFGEAARVQVQNYSVENFHVSTKSLYAELLDKNGYQPRFCC